MSKINNILKRFDEDYGSFQLSNVVDKQGYDRHKQFLLTAIKEVVEDIEPQTFETFNENGYLVEAVDEFDFRKQKTNLLSQIDKELNK